MQQEKKTWNRTEARHKTTGHESDDTQSDYGTTSTHTILGLNFCDPETVIPPYPEHFFRGYEQLLTTLT